MKKHLPIILIVLGLAIAAISYFGYQAVNKKSDIQIMQEYVRSQDNKQAALVELAKKVLDAPESCKQVKALPFLGICELEPYEGNPAPTWYTGLNDFEKNCIVQAFHVTNEHAYKFRDSEYQSEAPSDIKVIDFSCDVSAATLFDDNIDYEDPNATAAELLESFYRERAGTRSGPKISY